MRISIISSARSPPPPPQQKPQLNYLLALIIILITAVAAIALAYRQRGTRVARRASAPPRIVDIERGKPPPAPTHRPPTAIQPVLPEHGVSEAIKPGHVPRVVGRRREKK